LKTWKETSPVLDYQYSFTETHHGFNIDEGSRHEIDSDTMMSITLKGHELWVKSISYFPDGQRMISGSEDGTARQWDVKGGKEIEEARAVCEGSVWAVAVSRNGRWVATSGGDVGMAKLKVCEVETGIVKTFKGHSRWIICIDISADNTLLASGSADETARIWNLDTGKLMAGPFNSEDYVGAVRFSPDSKKLAFRSYWGSCLEVWDVQSQKLDVRIGTNFGTTITYAPIFWTNDKKTIIAAFSFTKDVPAKTVYEFDGSTLETVGTPFQGHTERVIGLALSFRGALLASASKDNTIKLWDYESRQLLASFDVQNPQIIVLSPNSRQLAYVINNEDENDYKICICDTPPDVLAQARVRSLHKHLLFVYRHSLTDKCTQKGSSP
jgi:WD40 repeat protein